MKKFFSSKLSKKYLIAIIVALLLLLIWLSVSPILNYFAERQVSQIIDIISNPELEKTLNDCSTILNFDKSKISKNNIFFNEVNFDKI